MTEASYQPGQRVLHPEFGEGVVVRIAANGYGQTFFPSLNIDNYTVDVTAAGYNPYNGVVAVSGYTAQVVNLTP